VVDAAPIHYETRDRVGYLTLDRPDAFNAVDEPMLAALETAVTAVATDEGVKALVISGSGETFCIGLDIDLLGRAFADTTYFRAILERFKRLLLAIEALPMPVVAAVNGMARAGGFELILACDLVLIADEARVADHHLSFGVVPGGGATQRAVRKLGDQRARELIFTARWVSGAEAVAIGLALRSVQRDALQDAVEDLVSAFRPMSRACLGATKQAINGGRDLALEQALDLEIDHFFRYLDEVPTSREGYTAYVENRTPEWP
jgi:enoyl-CoA hydratase/carnithine racemase